MKTEKKGFVLFRPLCWVRSVKWSLQANAMVSGHSLIEGPSYEKDGRVYIPARCSVCTYVSTCWYDKNNPPLEV